MDAPAATNKDYKDYLEQHGSDHGDEHEQVVDGHGLGDVRVPRRHDEGEAAGDEQAELNEDVGRQVDDDGGSVRAVNVEHDDADEAGRYQEHAEEHAHVRLGEQAPVVRVRVGGDEDVERGDLGRREIEFVYYGNLCGNMRFISCKATSQK